MPVDLKQVFRLRGGITLVHAILITAVAYLAIYFFKIDCRLVYKPETDMMALADPRPSLIRYPLGKESPAGYYIAEGFRENGNRGEEWKRGFNSGKQVDTIYAIANGLTYFCRSCGANWRKVIRVRHREPKKERPSWESVYGNLDEIFVEPYVIVRGGQPIGTVSNIHTNQPNTFHFEIRSALYSPIRGKHGKLKDYQVEPIEVIKRGTIRK